MKKKYIIMIVVLIAVIIIFAVISNAAKMKNKIEFLTEKVTKGSITNDVSTTGELQPVTKVDIGSQVSGKIIALYVDYNSRVKKDQAIALIDTSIYKSKVTSATADLQQAEANLSQAKASYENAVINITVAEHDIKTATTEVKKARISIRQAMEDEISKKADIDSSIAKMNNSYAQQNRYRALYTKNYASQTDKEKMETDYAVDKANHKSALAKHKNALESIDSAKTSLDQALSKLKTAEAKKAAQQALALSSKAQVDSAEAKMESARAILNEAQINLDYCTIRSPINGIVISKEVEAGQTVQASFQTPKLLTIAQDLKKMQINADVDEADIAIVKIGQEATFTIEAYQQEIFKGKVSQIRSSKSNQGVITYQVIIKTDNSKLKLKPGMTATVNIHTNKVDDVIKVPAAAIRFKPDSITNFPYPKGYKKNDTTNDSDKDIHEVWMLGKNKKPEPVKIQTGLGSKKYIEMKSGPLKEGDLLITASKNQTTAPEGTYK